MNILFDRIDAMLATSNPFTTGSISAALGFLLALAFMGYSVTRLFTFKPPSTVDEDKRNEALKAILRTSHANPPMSQPAKKGLGYTKDDAAVDAAEVRRRTLNNLMQMTDRRPR